MADITATIVRVHVELARRLVRQSRRIAKLDVRGASEMAIRTMRNARKCIQRARDAKAS